MSDATNDSSQSAQPEQVAHFHIKASEIVSPAIDLLLRADEQGHIEGFWQRFPDVRLYAESMPDLMALFAQIQASTTAYLSGVRDGTVDPADSMLVEMYMDEVHEEPGVASSPVVGVLGWWGEASHASLAIVAIACSSFDEGGKLLGEWVAAVSSAIISGAVRAAFEREERRASVN